MDGDNNQSREILEWCSSFLFEMEMEDEAALSVSRRGISEEGEIAPVRSWGLL
jgi:hypothetical protein